MPDKIFAVAPMMDCTDRHCRVLHRALSRRAWLYTEMVTAEAVIRGDRARLIGFSDAEHPVALQLGGSDPGLLARAARLGEAQGYDEINLNVGCPSDRVQSGRFGACLMAEPALVAAALAGAVRRRGVRSLPWSKAALQLIDRAAYARRADPDGWPDLSDEALSASLETWLGPHLAGRRSLAEIGPDVLSAALDDLVGWNRKRELDRLAPTHFTAPTGSNVPIDYEAEQGPTVSIRVQELFGLARHPAIAGGRMPLVIELLSPAHRPVQVTRDLPGFWRGSYADVKAEMRGRYPKHPWPDDPLSAPATRRAKRRGE